MPMQPRKQPQQSRILQAVAALKAFDRARAVQLLREELRHGPPSGNQWRSVSMLASQIGEIEIALEAARRFAHGSQSTLGGLLYYWGELATYDRIEEARKEIARLPANVREQPALLHFLGTLAGQEGEFEQAQDYYRRTLARAPAMPQTWFALAMLKTFAPGDTDLEAMERLRPQFERAEPALYARFLYGLAKAWHDCGEFDRAWQLYSQGAALRKREEKWDPDLLERFAGSLIRDFTAEAASKLTPPAIRSRPALFINGLPRSGTTLVEQILVSHSRVAAGGEVNLLRASLLATGDHTLAGALAYQERFSGPDPWGALATGYFNMLEARFRTRGLVVDKTLGQSHFMGLLLHMLPGARVIWMRRSPEDVALSCFRNFFSSAIPWSWSFPDIARFFNIEDRLFAHWTEQFPDRILTVPYEEMVHDPDKWIGRILDHAGLEDEPQLRTFHETRRNVKTASVSQVRQPISTSRIGLSQAYDAHLTPFREAYRG